ncbi:hypothetical protein AVEN_188156-1 [Araneus ventricosus]|uniref:Uncharacterized protein n=1 Tax=Araneus ventricosus TaxID=182803 RepID=A0A4Y2S9V3_ARAVE|nr:hypothetical protein AVEN_188156-1 [Araneus ventricosus]
MDSSSLEPSIVLAESSILEYSVGGNVNLRTEQEAPLVSGGALCLSQKRPDLASPWNRDTGEAAIKNLSRDAVNPRIRSLWDWVRGKGWKNYLVEFLEEKKGTFLVC